MATSSIPTFRKLVLRGTDSAITQLLSQLSNILPATWQRDTISEARVQDSSMGGIYYCYQFAGSEEPELPPSTLWLFVEKEMAQVVNIVAPSLFELGYDRYNAILVRFAEYVNAAISQCEISVEVQPWQEPTLEDILQQEPARLFRKFATLANPSTGTMHPADNERWQEFLISAYKHNVEPDTDLLRRWLMGECKWPEEMADNAMDEMQAGLKLLRKFQNTSSTS